MIRYLLDTNVISELARYPQGPMAEKIEPIAADALLTSVIAVGELKFGFHKQPSAKREAQVRKIMEGISVAPIDESVGEVYGRIRAELERVGTPIGGNDLWIAAQALALDCTLVTANEREFRRVHGLRVENWLA